MLQLRIRPPPDADAIRQDQANQSLRLATFIRDRLDQPPLESVARILLRMRQDEIARELLGSYDQFLGILLDADNRKELEYPKLDDALHSRVWKEARSASHLFRDAVEALFLAERTLLRDLTLRYGRILMLEVILRPIGFSSGALAKGDYKRGIALQREDPTLTALEISALREPELEPLVEAAAAIDLGQFAYISFHAPSAFRSLSEEDVVTYLERLPDGWPIVVHPDLIQNAAVWRRLGARLCLENMDLRKRTGRTVDEMQAAFDLLPDAGFCLDLGHARQIDPTMGLAVEMLREFGNRLRQLHVSEVGTFGEHRRIGYLARGAFARVVSFLPSDVPVILESVVTSSEMQAEVDTARELFAA